MVAAALEDPQGRVLIAQRPAGKHMAGAWEFPGGKIEQGEAPLQALARELREELGIEIGAGPHRPVRRIEHSYADRDVSIDVWRIQEFSGNPRGMDAQALRWCSPDQLEQAPLLPADKPIVAALRLPSILESRSAQYYSVETREAGKCFGTFCESAQAAMAAEHAGADFVVMRIELPPDSLMQLCRVLQIPVFAAGISLHSAWGSGASGIHRLCHQPGQG